MPYCSDCGKRVDAQVFYCPACGGPMQFAPPPPKPGVYTQQDQVAFRAAPYDADADEQFLDSFSWGPGCGIYFWSNPMGMFLLMNIVLNVLSALVEAPFTATESAPAEPTGGQLMISFLIFLAAIGVMIWAGKVARRRRWSGLKWRDFEHFRRDEHSWSIAGIIGWVIVGCMLILGFLGGLLSTLPAAQ
jgi:hypothetical protein